MLKINKNNRGFTLIEIIVSLAVFSTVVLIILGAVLAIMNLQRRTNAFRVAQENLSYAFESMVKEMRTGSLYENTLADPASIEFINDQNKKVFYRLEDGQIKKCAADGREGTECPIPNSYLPLTSTEVAINRLSFVINGSGADDEQPTVKIILSGSVGANTKYKYEFFLQTVVTQRKIDS